MRETPGPALVLPPLDQLEAGVRELVATVRAWQLRALLERLVAPGGALWPQWSIAPAAKRYHEAYRHGLLEHSLAVARGVSALAANFPGLDRDLAVTGALLHDVGKAEAYAFADGGIVLTDAGKLQGEIALGYFRVRRATEEVPGFPPETADALLHIVLSHHGRLEYGSPVVPCSREAVLVHMVDNLSAQFGSFARLERSLAEGERWSPFDRALDAPAYFAGRRAA
jgi:3'-5' exoribonuclease